MIMKKMFLSVAIVIAALVGITSCTSDASQCYQITVEFEEPVYKRDAETGKIISQVFERRTSTTYVYMTSTNVNVAISEMKRGLQVENCINIKVTKQKLDHNAGDCDAMNGSGDWWD